MKKMRLSFLRNTIVTGCILVATAFGAHAQYPYVVDFETDGAGNAPAKSYAATDPELLNNINWVMPGVYLGTMQVPPGDKFNGDHAARMRKTSNTTGDPGYMQMDADLPNGIGTVTLQAAMYGTETGGSFGVFYSTNGGSSWTQAGANVSPTDALQEYSFTIEQSGAVRIKIQKQDTSSARINFDDISMTQFGTATSLGVVSKAPQGSNIPLATNTLTITFSENIAAGTGNFTLTKVGGSSTNYAVSSAAISGATATVSGIALDNASQYYVELPAGAFTTTDGTLSSTAISGTSAWAFSTVDTTTPPVVTLTSLNETFTECAANAMGVFTQYSVTGNKTWFCSNFGHSDTDAVYINGGSAAGVSEANEDWLITSGPLDLSAMTAPQLSFWQKRRFDGGITRTVKVSTNYVAGTDPSAATWTTLSVPAMSSAPDSNVWAQVSNIALTSYKSTPFYLAFTYECGDAGAYELTYDDIKVAEPVGIYNIGKSNVGITVLGDAQRNNITLSIDLKSAMNAHISVYDMQGRKLYQSDNKLNVGNNTVALQGFSLNNGMYVIRVEDGRQFGAVKAIVK